MKMKMKDVIKEAESILNLKEDWDDEGAKIILRETFDKMSKFLLRQEDLFFEKYSWKFSIPDIAPSPDGSIDVHWKEEKFEILVNIHPHPNKTMSYYGDDQSGNSIKGYFHHINVGLIIDWLKWMGE